MSRLHHYDDHSVEVHIIPQQCRECGERTDRIRLSLDVVADEGGLIGIRTVGQTQCCQTVRPVPYPAAALAQVLDRLNDCPNH